MDFLRLLRSRYIPVVMVKTIVLKIEIDCEWFEDRSEPRKNETTCRERYAADGTWR